MFYTAVEGVAGAMGHPTRLVERLTDKGTPDLLIADFGSLAIDAAELAAAVDPMHTVIFSPHVRVEVFTGARAVGIVHVYRRGALARELPRLLGEYGEESVVPKSPQC